jgi:hypothetical protein
MRSQEERRVATLFCADGVVDPANLQNNHPGAYAPPLLARRGDTGSRFQTDPLSKVVPHDRFGRIRLESDVSVTDLQGSGASPRKDSLLQFRDDRKALSKRRKARCPANCRENPRQPPD